MVFVVSESDYAVLKLLHGEGRSLEIIKVLHGKKVIILQRTAHEKEKTS